MKNISKILFMSVVLSLIFGCKDTGVKEFDIYGNEMSFSGYFSELQQGSLDYYLEKFFENTGREVAFRAIEKNLTVYIENNTVYQIEWPDNIISAEKENAGYFLNITETINDSEFLIPNNYSVKVYQNDELFKDYIFQINFDSEIYTVKTYRTYVSKKDLENIVNKQSENIQQ